MRRLIVSAAAARRVGHSSFTFRDRKRRTGWGGDTEEHPLHVHHGVLSSTGSVTISNARFQRLT